jgi:hypothetical protein
MTSFTENMKTRTYRATEDLSDEALRFVGRDGAGVAVAGAGEAVAGVLIVGGLTDHAVSVAYDGVLQVIAGDAIDAGAAVASDAEGRAVPAGEGDVIAGYARQDAVEGQILSIDFVLGGNAIPVTTAPEPAPED